MKQRKHKINIFVANSHKMKHHRYNSGIEIDFLPSINMASMITKTPYPVFLNISDHLKQIDPDIVHINSHLFYSNYQVAKAAHARGIPIIVTVHGVIANRGRLMNTLQTLYLRTLARSLLNMSKTVICLTKNDAQSIGKLLGSTRKIKVIPNGVDISFFNASSEKNAHLIVWVGRFVPEKGLIYLLRAMKWVVANVPTARLVLVGDGFLQSKLMRITRNLELRDHVKFMGMLGRNHVAEILSKASVFAFPSLREGLPLSILEAMACGLPIAGSDIPGINNIVDKGVSGFLVPPRDPVSLAKAIVSLLKNEEQRRFMSEASRQIIVKKYNWPRAIQKIEQVYNDVN